MLGKVVYISDNEVHVKLQEGMQLAANLMNIHVILEDDDHRVLGEIVDISQDIIKVGLLGEFDGNTFFSGVIRKPTLNAKIRLINKDELASITGNNDDHSFLFGTSPLYNGYPIYTDINKLFSNHLAIFGNSGSGKSCGVARILQNIFSSNVTPYRANFLIFDAYGEYHNAFKDINKINPAYNFKYYTTNKVDNDGERLRIPIWLFDIDDMALLLSANNHSQLTIIEKMLKLANIFASQNEISVAYKNHLIAKAMINVLYTNQTSASKRNDAFSILSACTTGQFNLEAPVQGVGYVRKFRDCFIIDNNGQFPESNLLMEYLTSFVKDEYDSLEIKEENYYTFSDLEKALNFTLISEGLLHNEKLYNEAISLKVRLHSLIISEYAEYFDYDKYIDRSSYIASLVSVNGQKAQIVNFNFEDVDDWFAKVITKFYVKMLFNFTKNLSNRATIPFNIFLEEAHRYVQKDNDQYLLGYNIFERVAKEGRKYGLILDLISQRPMELSETVISQVSNFIIFKITHPLDSEYVRKMLPNVSTDIVDKQKNLQPGTCVTFGNAFKIPIIVHLEMPEPAPCGSNCDVVDNWQEKS